MSPGGLHQNQFRQTLTSPQFTSCLTCSGRLMVSVQGCVTQSCPVLYRGTGPGSGQWRTPAEGRFFTFSLKATRNTEAHQLYITSSTKPQFNSKILFENKNPYSGFQTLLETFRNQVFVQDVNGTFTLCRNAHPMNKVRLGCQCVASCNLNEPFDATASGHLLILESRNLVNFAADILMRKLPWNCPF